VTRVLLIFLDGIGLGDDDPAVNPFAAAQTPTLDALAGGHKWLRGTSRTDTGRALFIPTDPRLGLAGRPQSATGQAAILTGRNVPAEIGEHYGPRPNPAVRAILDADNVFKRVIAGGGTAALINAYPPRFHELIASGKRLPSSIQQAALSAGLRLFTDADLYAGTAMSPDWTGEGWRAELGYSDTPVYGRAEAGALLARLAMQRDFTFFSHWVTDVIGHRGPFERGVAVLELFDGVMAGLLDAWDDDAGLIVITSDHGNMEDLSTRKHTENDVPTVVIGAARHLFADGLHDLSGITPGILRVISPDGCAAHAPLEAVIRAWAESLLDPSRIAHVRGVVETAAALAEWYAPHEITRVRLAGWIHDTAKHWDDAALLAYADAHDLPVTDAERQVPMLLHGAVAYDLAREQFGLADTALRDACALHTTGAPGMDIAAKIVYLADLIEPSRDFKGVKALRKEAARDLDAAVLLAADTVIKHLIRRQRIVDPRGLALHNALLAQGVRYSR